MTNTEERKQELFYGLAQAENSNDLKKLANLHTDCLPLMSHEEKVAYSIAVADTKRRLDAHEQSRLGAIYVDGKRFVIRRYGDVFYYEVIQ